VTRKKSYFLLMLLLVLGGLGLRDLRFGPSEQQARVIFSVILEHNGIPGPSMEESITIPLERAVGSLAGIQQLQSLSEFGRSRLNITLSPETSQRLFFIDLRDRVYQVYNSLPPSVQKPRIFSNTGSQNPDFLISFRHPSLPYAEQRSSLEREIKPLFEAIPGVGEVRVYGGVLQEIHISYDPAKALASGLNPGLISRQLQDNNLLEPLGLLAEGALRLPLLLDGSLEGVADIREVLLPIGEGQAVKVQDVGTVNWQIREKETINRIDGQEGLTLAVFPSGGGNPLSISQALSPLLDRAAELDWETAVLLDQGSKVSGSLFQIGLALLVAAAALALLFFLIYRRGTLIALFMVFFGVSIFLTLSILTALGVTVSTEVLAGIALGIGLIADNGILGLEHLRGQLPNSGSTGDLRSSLVASNLTTIIALLPLMIVDRILPSLTPVFQSLIAMLGVSLVLVLVFFPLLVESAWSQPRLQLSSPAWRGFWSLHWLGRPLLAAVTILPLALVFLLPKSFSQDPDPGVLFAKAEYPSGKDLGALDQNMPAYLSALSQLNILTQVESTSRDESVSLTFTYDQELYSALEVKNQVNELSGLLGDASLIFVESAFEDRLQVELGVYGEDLELIHDKAREALGALSAEDWALGGVYHFKPNPQSLVLLPRREVLGSSLLPPSQIAEHLKWSLQGPVTDKIFIQGDETDIRIFAQDAQAWTKKDLRQVRIPTSSGPLDLDALMNIVEIQDFVRITRRGGQRVALFTLEARKMDLGLLERRIQEVTRSLSLPQGYSIQISPKIFQFQADLQTLLWVFLGGRVSISRCHKS
jgi:HAE1 family hydrophobic/amphiphilic exporter-1